MRKEIRKIVIIGIVLSGISFIAGFFATPVEKTGQEAGSFWQEKELVPQVDTSILRQQEGLYYYETFTSQQKDIYAQIYEAIITREEKILSGSDADVVDEVYQCVMKDHPEIFYSGGYKLKITEKAHSKDTPQITFWANYHMTESEVEENQARITQSVRGCLERMPGGLDEYGQVKYVYEYVISHTEYELNSDNNQNICSVFLGGKSVCQGYAKAVQYLLRELGFEITVVTGTMGEGEPHAWNLVRVDGDYYYMDPTAGDASYQTKDSLQTPGTENSINYDYFLVTTQQLTRTHVIDNLKPLPACVATRNNYFVREGLYITAFDEIKLKNIFEQAYAAGKNQVTVRCADESVYGEMKERLISNQEIFGYMHVSTNVTYSCNDDLYTLIFWIG